MKATLCNFAKTWGLVQISFAEQVAREITRTRLAHLAVSAELEEAAAYKEMLEIRLTRLQVIAEALS